ncbi:MAG TPA: peptidase S41, partial [Epsilonproteobacteria bacterium]|nr:peptidase S41 [Campylobacterota bacterium]
IVSQKGRTAIENMEYTASSEAGDTETPLVVIVNGGSASASEIVSGALQDFKRGIVVGEKTFGKGSVQVVMPVGEGEALKLPVARYYLPSGRTIQAEGVTPDIIVHRGEIAYKEDPAILKEEALQKHLKSELEKIDGITNTVSTENNETNATIITEQQLYKDAQLKSAVDILKALIITEGGN